MQRPQPEAIERITVHIDREFEDIVPSFLANRRKDLHTLRHALADEDFSTIRMLGHRMKGDGGGYGFDRITDIGGALELAADHKNRVAAEQHITQLDDFLARLHVEYR